MPEAPQIRLLVDKMKPFIGESIISASALTDALDLKRLEGQTLNDIEVFGKQILLKLPEFSVRIHLMLFGYVHINKRKPDGKLRLGLTFDDGEINFYASDIYFIEEPLEKVFDWTIDVMSPAWDAEQALKKLDNYADEVISDVLIDQDVFNGLGNKGVNESLYRTKVHPASLVKALPKAKRKEIIQEAVQFSFDYYQWESAGTSKDHFLVYLKKKCPLHGTLLRHEKIGSNGRKCHFCDECQQLYFNRAY